MPSQFNDADDDSPMVTSPYYNLVLDWCIVVLLLCSAFGNGFILFLFQRSQRLRKNDSLRVVLVLVISDILFAVFSIPHLTNYLISWSPQQLNYDARLVIWFGSPQSLQMKMSLVTSSAIAIDRLQAMRWPLYYRKKSQRNYVIGTVLLGVTFGAVDVLLQNVLSPLRSSPGCAAIGCFMSRQARFQWGISNMTNRLCIGVLAISIFFLLVPSSLVGLSDLAGIEMFSLVGPYFMVGLLLAGISNSIVYISLHIELREAAKSIIFRRQMAGQSGTSLEKLQQKTTLHTISRPVEVTSRNAK